MQDVSVVERRRSSSGVSRARSVRSSLKLIGARWRSSVLPAANSSAACRAAATSAANNSSICPGIEELNPQPTAETEVVPACAAPTAHQSLPVSEPQRQKQKSSRASSLFAIFANQQSKHLKSTSAREGKQKERKSKTAWMLAFTYQKNKQGKGKPVCSESAENEESVEENLSFKDTWNLDRTDAEEVHTECTDALVIVRKREQNWPASAETLDSPDRTYARQKSSSMSRCASLLQREFLQHDEFPHQQEFLHLPQSLPASSSEGTKRRNSMWALSSSKSST
jgi:hypothetical protein